MLKTALPFLHKSAFVKFKDETSMVSSTVFSDLLSQLSFVCASKHEPIDPGAGNPPSDIRPVRVSLGCRTCPFFEDVAVPYFSNFSNLWVTKTGSPSLENGSRD
jgi:hypothetical protein